MFVVAAEAAVVVAAELGAMQKMQAEPEAIQEGSEHYLT